MTLVLIIILLSLFIIASDDNFVKMKVSIFGHKLEHQYPRGYLCPCRYCKLFKKKNVFNTKLQPDFTEEEELIARDLILIRFREMYKIHYPDRVVNTITITSVSYPEVFVLINEDAIYGGKIILEEKFINDIRRQRKRNDIIDSILD